MNENEVVQAWRAYINTITDWQALMQSITPKDSANGLIYELDNPLGRPNESFAIADMRKIDISEPHYHKNGETEIYFVIEGSGQTVVGNDLLDLNPGDCVVIPPETNHVTRSNQQLLLAVINTPPYDALNYVTLDDEENKKTLTLLG